MLSRIVSLMLVGVTSISMLGFEAVSAQTGNEAEAVSKTRARVNELGTGRNARVELKLQDNTKVKGYISEVGEDTFTITDAKTGASQTVSFAEVVQIKKQRSGISPLTWGIIGGAAAAAVIVGVTVIKPVVCDGGAGC